MADPWDDPEVNASPAAATAVDPWDAPTAAPSGGLLQTIPQGIEFMGSEEGRAKLWEGIKKFPGDFAQGMIDFVKLPGKGFNEGGVTLDEEIAWSLNAALGTIGTGTKFPRAVTESLVPHVQEFEAGVTRPAAEGAVASEPERIVSAAVKVNDKIYTGDTHLDALDKAAAELKTDVENIHIKVDDTKQSQFDAWVTSDGRFVDSKEAAKLVNSPHEKLDSLDPEFLQQKEMPTVARDIIEGKRAGIIGPDIPPPPAESPAASAQRAIPASSQPGDKITMTPAGEPIDAWAERFNRYVDKTETPDDFKTLVKDMAAQNNNFPEARAGDVAPDMVAKVAEAAGLDAADIHAGKLRTSFRTDDEIRTVTTLLKKLGDDVQSAAELVRTDDSPESLAAFQAAIIKRDYALEATLSHTVALRAEWGRSGNALQEILRAQKGEDPLTKLLQDKGRSVDDLRDIARGLNGLDREQAAKVLTGMRGQAPHWFYWMWTQGLISGPFTHAKYVLANATYATMERGVTTPLASIIGKAKQMAGAADTDRVFFGETAAAYYGTVAAVPDAIRATYQTLKTGMRVPLESEKQLHDLAIANGEKPSTALSRAMEPNLQPPRPIPGIWGRILGAPGDAASSIHVAFKVLGERANLEMWAYHEAAKDGHSPAPIAAKAIPVTGEQLRSGRAKPESDYHMSPAAMMEPEPYHAFTEMARQLPEDVNSKFQVHGLLAGDRDANLVNLLKNGIDPNREFHSGNPRGGTHGVDSTRTFGSPYLLLSDEGKGIRQTGVKNVVTVGPAEVNLPALKAAFPDVNFMTVSEAERFMTNGERPAGLAPTEGGQTFWQRRAYHALNPTEKALKDSVYQAYKDTFMQELGEHAKKFQEFTKKVPGAKWVFPFTHIPINLMKATYEYTPFAALDKDMRANITGTNGGRAQDLAIARMTVGSSVMAYFAHKYLQGQVTSNYPTDQNERKDWALQHKPANSIQIGDRWVSFERFGPAGDLAQIGAAIASIGHRFMMDKEAPDKGTDEAFSHAVWATANAAANTIGNEVGFQSLRNFMDAIEDEKKGGSFASYQTTSMLPFSSLLSQTASFMDPHMRIAKSMVNGLLYRIPELRETLQPKRDPLYGEPLENPGYHGIVRSVPINADPVKLELERVNLHPSAPRDVIGGVKLTPEQYDRYQATAGPLVQRALGSLVNHPGWQDIPASARAETLRATISAMRQQAATAMQIADPKLIQQGLQQRLDYISGRTNTPRPKRPPELAPQP